MNILNYIGKKKKVYLGWASHFMYLYLGYKINGIKFLIITMQDYVYISMYHIVHIKNLLNST